MLKPIWWHRDLLLSVLRTQFQLRYRQSADPDLGPVRLPATWSGV